MRGFAPGHRRRVSPLSAPSAPPSSPAAIIAPVALGKPGSGGARGKRLLWLSFGALGVVYGDIGTSPLYALKECFAHLRIGVSESEVFGILSLVFWALIAVVTLKYLMIILRADNHGEGGVLALGALIGRTQPRRAKTVLLALGLFGAALLYGDGMITPA